MSEIVLKVEDLSKQYRLGEVGTGTISHDLNRWWARVRGREDPFSRIGQVNDRTKAAESDYVWALKDIGFTVQQGQVLGIIGKNGAGKSTLLKLISQITAPTTGIVKAKGRIASLLEVGTGMHPEMTARENIFLNGAIMGMTKKEIKRKFDEIIDFAGCNMYVDTPVKRFSSGMRVRLGFAVAAFLEPEILIVDEVLAVGDAEFQKKAVGKMKDVSSGDGRTVLFVSHNMGSVLNLCDRAILLNNGMIRSEGDVRSVVEEYLRKDDAGDFAEGVKRRGLQQVTVNNLTFLNERNTVIDDVVAGESLRIEITYSSQKEVLEKVVIGLVIENKQGQFLTVLNNKMANFDFELLPGKGKIVCEIPRLPLMKGPHSLSLKFYSNGEPQDIIEPAKEFYVEEKDFYGSGFVNTSNRQGIYVEQIWKSFNN